MSLVERLDEAFNQREKRWPTYDGKELDRNTTLGSSEALRCIRWTWFAKHGVEQDEDFDEDMGYALRGDYVEKAVMEGLETVMEDNEVIFWSGKEQISFVDTGGKVSATPDGLYTLWDKEHSVIDTCLIEVKSIDPRTNWDNLPRAKDVVQTNIAMGLINRLSQYTVDRCRLIYVDASQYTKQAEYPYDYDGGEALQNAENRAKRLFEANDGSQLPAEGAMTDECKFCPFKQACGEAVVTKKKVDPPKKKMKVADSTMSDLEIAVNQYASADESEKMAKAIKSDLKKEIVGMMKPGSKVIGEYHVEIMEIAGRKSLDRKKLEERFGDLSEFEKVGAPSVRLTIKS